MLNVKDRKARRASSPATTSNICVSQTTLGSKSTTETGPRTGPPRRAMSQSILMQANLTGNGMLLRPILV